MSYDYILGFCKVASDHGITGDSLTKIAALLHHTRVLDNPALKLIHRLIRSPKPVAATRYVTIDRHPARVGASLRGIVAALKAEQARILQDVSHARAVSARGRLMGAARSVPSPSLYPVAPLQRVEFSSMRRTPVLREIENRYSAHPDISRTSEFGREADTEYVNDILKELGVR